MARLTPPTVHWRYRCPPGRLLLLPCTTSQHRSYCCTPPSTLRLGAGGHTAEMLALLGGFDLATYRPRCYVVAATDSMSSEKAASFEAAAAAAAARAAPADEEAPASAKKGGRVSPGKAGSPGGGQKTVRRSPRVAARAGGAADRDSAAGSAGGVLRTALPGARSPESPAKRRLLSRHQPGEQQPAYGVAVVPRSREVGQSWASSVPSTLRALWAAGEEVCTPCPCSALPAGPGADAGRLRFDRGRAPGCLPGMRCGIRSGCTAHPQAARFDPAQPPAGCLSASMGPANAVAPPASPPLSAHAPSAPSAPSASCPPPCHACPDSDCGVGPRAGPGAAQRAGHLHPNRGRRFPHEAGRGASRPALRARSAAVGRDASRMAAPACSRRMPMPFPSSVAHGCVPPAGPPCLLLSPCSRHPRATGAWRALARAEIAPS